jgi:sugar phosphate isomerase/epimerase
MKFSIASYSFHRELQAGKQDMFKYIEDCKALGMSQLDPWNGHLVPLNEEDERLKENAPETMEFSAENKAYIAEVKAAAEKAGLPFGCLAVDGPHIYEETEAARRANRVSAYRWIEVARLLGAKQIRIDAGGPETMTDEMLEIILAGYKDIVPRANQAGLEVVIENHWGPSQHPENLTKILGGSEGLGLLFDTNNWTEGRKEDCWAMFAKDARSVHIKTFEFDKNGDDPTVDVAKAVKLLVEAGYDGVWGIESVPRDGDEYGAIKKTKALVERILQGGV